ncbi:MAG: hypothetical protein CMJ49_14610 [Planctomycetaceae bacterium]|nr:hypothetical protein [Planctomycetaceae bacterium]
MTDRDGATERLTSDGWRGGRGVPVAVWAIALIAAVLHLMPHVRAMSQAPEGWVFTGTTNVSPDVMQYRSWMRRTQVTGVLVDNRFTTEANEPYLPVLVYYMAGQVSAATGASPEWVFAGLGSAAAFALTVLLFVTVRRFCESSKQMWWVFGVVLLGGGLGAYLKVLQYFGPLAAVRDWAPIDRTLIKGVEQAPVFEDYRGQYVYGTLFDAHFAVIWVLVLLSILAMVNLLSRPSVLRAAVVMVSTGFVAFVHVYSGLLLGLIAVMVALVCRLRGVGVRGAVTAACVTVIGVGGVLGFVAARASASGLPMPTWRDIGILPATVLIGYPLVWLVIPFGLGSFWKQAEVKRCVLVGWGLGCLCMLLSGPFFPYPARGALTLAVPLYLIAGSVFFERFDRVKWWGVGVVVVLLGASPVLSVYSRWESTSFDADRDYMFESADHRVHLDYLDQHAEESDVLLVDFPDPPNDWRGDALWLLPAYRGIAYCGHFFLTVGYEEKRPAVHALYRDADAAARGAFLREHGIGYVFVGPTDDAASWAAIKGLSVVVSNGVGALLEHEDGSANGAR